MSIRPNSDSFVHINDNTLRKVDNEIEDVINTLVYIDEKILNKDLIDTRKLSNMMFNIRRRIFKVNFKIHELELLTRGNNKKIERMKRKLKFMHENFKLINDYNIQILQRNKKKAIDTLTIVNTIFLPLALITGYFGMNFKSMGAPSNKTGIFTLKYGQGFVLALFVSLTLFVVFLFYSNILPQ